MATVIWRFLKSLKIALFAFVGGYIGFVIYCIMLTWGPGKENEPPPVFLWAIPAGIIAALIAFVVTFYLTGREIDRPPSLMKFFDAA